MAIRAPVDEVMQARERIDRVHGEVEEVLASLLAASAIPWSGPAAEAWRDRVAAVRRSAGAGLSSLTELRALLDGLESELAR